MAKLTEAYVEVGVDTGPLNTQLGGLQGMLTSRLGAIGAAAGTAFSSAFTVGATAGLAALAGGIGIAGLTTKLASDAEEAASKFGFVFENAGDKTGKSLDEFATAAGRSQIAMRGMAADIGALVKPMGFSADATGEMSVKVTKLATDLASFFNSTDAEALTALRAGLVGESEPLRRFGVQLNEARIQAEAMALGLAKTKDDVKGAVKAQAIMSIVTKDTAAAQGDAVRTAGSFANSFKAMQGVFQDLGVEIGQVFLPTMTAITQAVRSVVGVIQSNTGILKEWGALIGESAKNILNALGTVAAKVAEVFGANLTSLVSSSTGGMVGSFSELVTKTLELLAVLTSDFGKTWELVKLGAQFAFNEVALVIAEKLQYAYAVAAGVFSGIASAGEAGFDQLKGFVEGFAVEFTAIFEGLKEVFTALANHALMQFKIISAVVPAMAKAVAAAAEAMEGTGAEGSLVKAFNTGRAAAREGAGIGRVGADAAVDMRGKFSSGFDSGFGGAMGGGPLGEMIERMKGTRDSLKDSMSGLLGGMMADREAKKPAAEKKAEKSGIISDTLKKVFTEGAGKLGEFIGKGSVAAVAGAGAVGAMAGDAMMGGGGQQDREVPHAFVALDEMASHIQTGLGGGKDDNPNAKLETIVEKGIEMVGKVAEALKSLTPWAVVK